MLQTYRIDAFEGVDQSADENSLAPGVSPDACNMDTSDGNLSVARGAVRHSEAPAPGEEPIKRLALFRSVSGDQFLAFSREKIYALRGEAWAELHAFSPALTGPRFDFEQARIGEKEYLIIATGETQMLKYDGDAIEAFGSSEGQSDIPASFLALYRSRLFCAGDAANPSRLTYSQLPGDGRSIENFGPVSGSPNVEGGHVEIGDTASDPIVALAALSNQLLIFKKRSLYRLIGDKPGNFIVERIDAMVPPVAHTALAHYGDAVYYLSREGLFVFNGVMVQPAIGSLRLRNLLKNAELAATRGAQVRDKLYFTLRDGEGDAMVEYDLRRRAFMLRRGIGITDICAWDDALLLINESRRLLRFNEGGDYDGAPIDAYWQTPLTDLRDKGVIKSLRELCLRAGEGGGVLLVEARAGANVTTYRALLPDNPYDVLELPLKNEARTLSLRFSNEAGGPMSISGGVELYFEQKRRVR